MRGASWEKDVNAVAKEIGKLQTKRDEVQDQVRDLDAEISKASRKFNRLVRSLNKKGGRSRATRGASSGADANND